MHKAFSERLCFGKLICRYTYLQCINVCIESISIHSAQPLLYWMSWQFLFLLKLLWLAYLKDASLQHSHTSLYYMLSYKQPSEQVFTFYAMLHGGWRSRYHSHRQSAAQDGQNGRLSSSFSFFFLAVRIVSILTRFFIIMINLH